MGLEPSWKGPAKRKIRSEDMEPVVGVDVAKGSSVVQAFRKRNEPVGKAIVISHGASGFEQFTEMLGALLNINLRKWGALSLGKI